MQNQVRRHMSFVVDNLMYYLQIDVVDDAFTRMAQRILGPAAGAEREGAAATATGGGQGERGRGRGREASLRSRQGDGDGDGQAQGGGADRTASGVREAWEAADSAREGGRDFEQALGAHRGFPKRKARGVSDFSTKTKTNTRKSIYTTERRVMCVIRPGRVSLIADPPCRPSCLVLSCLVLCVYVSRVQARTRSS